MPTFKPILFALSLAASAAPAAAQNLAPSCLHGPDETAANRARRQQAVQYAAKVNAAEGRSVPRLQKYRPLNELANLPPLPAGFDIQFYTDGLTYTFSLKDTRDACHYAIFSDQDQGIYQGTARIGAQVIPAEIP